MELTSVERAKMASNGERVVLKGWIYIVSSLGRVLFVRMRDHTGIIQAVAKQGLLKDEEIEQLKNLGRESSIVINGIISKDSRAPGGVEVLIDGFKVVSPASKDYPVGKRKVSPKLAADLRHLYLRSQRMTAIMRVRSELLSGFREYLTSEGFYEFSCPTTITASVEGGATLFELNYYGKRAYLTQSSQFYLEAGIFSLGKVFTVQPSFRAERSKTPRHLTEYWHLEAEAAWVDNEGMMDFEERMLEHISSWMLERVEKEIKMLNPDYKPLKRPFRRVTYSEAINAIGKEWDADIGADEEKEIMKIFGDAVFVTHFPKELKALYHKPDPGDQRLVLCHDLLLWPVGEVIGGGQRADNYEQLYNRIVSEGFDPEDYRWYLDLRKYGSVPHSGFGLGIERFLAWMLRLPHIRYAVPFPRTTTRVYP